MARFFRDAGCAIIIWIWGAGVAASPCVSWVTQVVSVQGNVAVMRQDQLEWVPARVNDRFCSGDRVRADVHSRAGLLLRNGTLLRLDQGTTLVLPSFEEDDSVWLELLRGAIHLISNTDYRLKVKTPFMNASIEGTEFAVRVAENDGRVWVMEGRVLVENPKGKLRLGAGHAAVALDGEAPQPYLKITPRDAVQWALYYPPIIDFRMEHTAGAAIQRAIGLYRSGRIPAAIEALNSIPAEARDPGFFTLRAAMLLTVGDVDPARSDIEKALALAPQSGTPLALQSIIALAQNEKDQALALASRANELEPGSQVPLVALSYARQAHFDLDGARADLNRALELSPDDPLAWSRLSELELSRGEIDEALAAAAKAEALDSNLSYPHTVLGFAHLSRIEVGEAKDAFHRAIELDPSAPLPRLGLGLAMIREGDLEEGTKEIEIAAVLDPENSLIRSYLGKAYYEQKRGSVATREFGLAKRLDPNDPTPWFYEALYKQSVNRPVEALEDLQKSIVLNDNRILYRSRLLLDQDLAARSAALARIYENLNFDKLGLVESFKSINKDPTNFSAHRFLSDEFAVLPRHEIAQASELLQAQLLQPINITPLQPQLSRTDLALLGGVGQTRPGSNEFNPLFNSNRVALQANGAAGSRNTWGDDVILSGIHDGLSISASQFHFENAGFRQNDWLRQNSYNLFSQMSVTPQLNVQAEVAYEEIQSGDLRTRLTGFHDNDVQENRYRTIGRAGLHYAIGPSQDLIFSAIYEKNNAFSENILSVADTSSKSDNYELELQHLYSGELFKTITGGGYVGGERRDKIDLVLLPPPFNHSSEKIPTEYYNGYAYSFLTPLHTLTATLGLSYDGFSEQEVNNNQWNPKFGLLWNPFEATTIRMAAFRVLKRPYTANQTIEPAQIAGFNQFFDENNGADYWRYGVGLDQKLGLGLFAGLEASWRDIEQPLFSTASGFATQNQNEQMHRAYLYWAPWSMLSVSLEYRYEFRDRSFDLRNSDLTNPTRLSTHIVPFSVNFFHPNGIFATFGGNYVDQQGDFVVSDTSQSSNRVDRFQDSFWVFDTSLGYRFPRRLGLVNLSVANLFNSSFLFQDDINPGRQRLPRFRPERTILVNVRFSF